MRNLVTAVLCCYSLFAADSPLDVNRTDPKAAGMNEEMLAKIPQRMKEFVAAKTAAGMVTLVARNGTIASFEAVGYQDAAKNLSMKKDSMFRIASLTKPITCSAIMILVDEGRLSLIDPVEKFLPEYKGQRMNGCGALNGFSCAPITPARPINIADLMTHTAGLPSSVDKGTDEPRSLADLVSRGAKLNLLFEPGTNWNYSNIGIDILGRIVEVVSKLSFDQFLAERVFQPLGMSDTYFFVPESKRNRLASLYSSEEGNLKVVDAEWGSQPAKLSVPAGGLVSTAADLLRFNEMMRNRGTLNGRRVLSASAVHLMTISHTGDMKAGWAPGLGHGFGYEVVRNVDGMFRYSSLGTFVKGGAYRTYEWVDGAKGLVGIFLMQRTFGPGDTSDEINSVMQIAAASID